jgi:hypothetical protein
VFPAQGRRGASSLDYALVAYFCMSRSLVTNQAEKDSCSWTLSSR